jgi:C4-dicarboxylate-binding protein DctP
MAETCGSSGLCRLTGTLQTLLIGCAFTLGNAFAITPSPAPLKTTADPVTWQADLPANIAPREAAVVRQLAQRMANAGRAVRIVLPEQAAAHPPAQILQSTVAGATQLALTPINLLSASTPEFAVFDSLFLFQSLSAVDRFTTSVEGRRALDALQKQGLRGMGFVHAGMVQIVARQPLTAASGFKGLKLAPTLATGPIARQFAALGATTAPLPGSEAAAALATGRVDAIEAGWPELSRSAVPSGAAVLESNHRYRGYVLVANNAAFEKLGRIAQAQLLMDAEAVIEDHNLAVQTAEKETRGKVLAQRKAVGGVTRADYDALYAQLKRGGWTEATDQQRVLASALAVSDLELARKYFGSVAPGTPPPRAPPYAMPSIPSMPKATPPPVDIAEPGLTDGMRLYLSELFSSLFGLGRMSSVKKVPTSPVVYNADLTPQLPRDAAAPNRPVLQAGQPTTLRFAIGAKWANSILPDLPPAPEILLSKDDLPLTVLLACAFCEPHADSLKRMVFRSSRGGSDEISFQFTPQRRPDANGYAEKLQLSIINDATGREYDRLLVHVAVADSGAATTAVAPAKALVFSPSKGADPSDWRPDVLLYANEDMGRNVTISIEPVSPEMKELLGPIAFDAQGVRRVFRSGIDDAQLIDAMTNSAYGAMSAVSIQGELLKKLSASGTDAVVSKESQDSLQLSDAESSNVAGVIAQTGQRLYRHLFYNNADTDLRKLIERMEVAASGDNHSDKPLRMMVITNRLSLPWQYLHPVGPNIDARKFWGMQFSLSVLRINNNASQKARGPDMDKARKVVFARYGSSADHTVPLAEKQAAQLLLLPLAQTDLLEVDTGPDLLEKVRTQRKEIAGIVTFLHASAGSGDNPPQLQFNTGDTVTSDNFDDLLSKVDAAEQDMRYLAGAPLVILNACETGPSRNLPHVKLENAMFMLGAQGVVVTEVSVWVSLGHEVATRLITRLSQGDAVSDALTTIRRELQAQKKNPLGLLYVYYGDPAATLRR